MKIEWFWDRTFRYDENSAWRLWGVWIEGKVFIGISETEESDGNKVWSKEEREKAAQQISEREGIPWTTESLLDVEHGSDRPMWTPLTRACFDLQCELNEALKLIKMFDETSNPYAISAGWDDIRDAWLSRNK